MVKVNDIEHVTVIGAGTMGHEIAQLYLMSGRKVVLADIKQEIVDNGAKEIKKALEKLEKKGKLEGTPDSLMDNLEKSTDNAQAVKNADFVIECVVEKMDIKKQVFQECDANAPKECIFASNTSMMSISEMASATNRPERVVGQHFFNPPILMRLIEAIAGEKTDSGVLEVVVNLGESLPCLRGDRFVPKVLKDRPGFIVNRINGAGQIYLNWVFDQAAEKNIPWEQVDADAKRVMPMGPCELADYVGLDIMKHTMEYCAEHISPDFAPGKVITEKVKEGELGQKTGKGFYEWPDEGKPEIDKSKKAGLFDVTKMMAVQLNEGCRLLKEGVVKGYKIIDKAMLAGMNVPGPFGAGKNNYEKWSEILVDLAEKTDKDYLKPIDLMKSGKFKKMKK